MADYVDLLAASVGLAVALLGFLGFLRFRSRRDRLIEIGASFTRLAIGLGSDRPVDRLASAALLPRFFDEGTELGGKGAPYASDTIRLATAVLKNESTGVLQKSLADGLAQAPSLSGVDFQKANLRNCFWGTGTGADARAINISGADFYRADLSSASLRGVEASGAIFKRAQLVGTVFKGANLRECNFDDANLRGARFDGACIVGASFKNAIHVPTNVQAMLDNEGKCNSEMRVAAEASPGPPSGVPVFLSRPSRYGHRGHLAIAQISRGLASAGASLVTLPPDEYGVGAPLDEVKQRISQCGAVIIVGVPQVEVGQAVWRAGTDEEKIVKGASFATP